MHCGQDIIGEQDIPGRGEQPEHCEDRSTTTSPHLAPNSRLYPTPSPEAGKQPAFPHAALRSHDIAAELLSPRLSEESGGTAGPGPRGG